MVIKEVTKEKIIENIFKIEKSISSEIKIFFTPKTVTAASIGIDNKKDIFVESNLSNLRNLAAVIAIPDRLTPGIKEKICKKPIIKADLRSKLISRLFSFSFLSEKYNKIPNNTVVHPIILSDLKSLIMPDWAIK